MLPYYVRQRQIAIYQSRYDVYACVPPNKIDTMAKSFPKHGLNKERLFSDSLDLA